ncbi:hypothetical protein NDQ71_01075 [Pseudoalteromonas sp. KG3]|uniref:hypothetical protein n=1 Tax=Pseudoalteromonas sp. KG3 TaxID=2951137 RepID=UPI002658C71E|nr:hypothetical protein [Pseudoalteromonas sp. KG3]WKD23726.1 hypothetical protein NDQ71_01075 [Pseudoalteromonas sp. KG3]
MSDLEVRILIALVSLLIGVIVGHFLALGRDIRSEYNTAITPLRDKLIKEENVSESLIKDLEVNLGSQSKKIASVYTNDYKPAIEKANKMYLVNDAGYMCVPEEKEEEHDLLLKEANTKLLNAAKRKLWLNYF